MTKYAVAMILGLLATSCTKDNDFRKIASEEFSENFKALVMGNKSIDPNQDWSTVASIPVTVSVDFEDSQEYTVYIYQTPPVLDRSAAYIGMAKVRSGESKTVPVIKPAKVGLLYAACFDASGHAMCKPFVAKTTDCSINFGGRFPANGSASTGNSWSVPTVGTPDISRYTSNLIQMTDSENETGREDSSEKHLLIGNRYAGLINRLNTFSNQSVYVAGTWDITFDQRVTHGNVVIVANGGRINIPKGFKLTTRSTSDAANGIVYIMQGGEIAGEGTVEFTTDTGTYIYNNGYITIKEVDLNGGTLYNYGTIGNGNNTDTELIGKEGSGNRHSILINHGIATFTQTSGDGLAIYNASTLKTLGELFISKSSRMDDGSYIECPTLTLSGSGSDVLYMGNAAYMNCTGQISVDNFGVWGPSGNGYRSNAFLKINDCSYCNTTSGAATTFLLDHVELILPENYPTIFDDGAIREWDSDIKSYGIGTLSPTYAGYYAIRLIYDWMNGYQGKLLEVGNYQWSTDNYNKYNYTWSNATEPHTSGIDESRQTCVYSSGPSYSSNDSGVTASVSFQKSYDDNPSPNYIYYAFEIADNNHDFNYNDLIIRLKTPEGNSDGSFSSVIEIVAVGTTLNTTLYNGEQQIGKEIHIAIGTSTVANISRINRLYRDMDTLTFDTPDFQLDRIPFKLHIVNSNNAENQFSEAEHIINGSPSFIVVSGDAQGKWFWPLDKMNIGLAYPLFNVWGNSITAAPDWYNEKNAASGKVLTW